MFCSVPLVQKFFRDLLLQKQPRITSAVRDRQDVLLLMSTIKKIHNLRFCCPKASLKDYNLPQDILAYVTGAGSRYGKWEYGWNTRKRYTMML